METLLFRREGCFYVEDNSGGVTIFYVKGNFTVIDSAYVGKSNSANLSKFIFCKSGVQTFSLPSSGVTFVSSPNIVDSLGFDLEHGDRRVCRDREFPGKAGASLGSGHPNGINGNVTSSGANGGGNIFSSAASYSFNGTAAQVTGTFLPSTVNNLTINNSAGVTLPKSDTVTGTLTLTNGILKVGSNNIITNFTSGGTSTSYVATDSATLKVNGVGSAQTIFPVGIAEGTHRSGSQIRERPIR